MFAWRRLFQNLNVINALLMAAIAFALHALSLAFLNPADGVAVRPAREAVAPAGGSAAPAPDPVPADYALISERNLFHPERVSLPEGGSEKPTPRPELLLCGTLITDTVRLAFVEDRNAPAPTAGRGKRPVVLKLGQHLGGYRLSEVEANRIVLTKGEERWVVRLDDRRKRRRGESGEAGAARGGADAGQAAKTSPVQRLR